MSRRRRGGHGDAGGHDGPDERWMASYMDMVTVLMCLFIVLYAISTVDQTKYEQLAASLATGFGQEASETADTASGTVVPAELVTEETGGLTTYELAQQEVAELVELREAMSARLTEQGVEDAVEFLFDERGLIVRLVGTETFFDSNQAALTPVARIVLDAVGAPLAASGYESAVEGHADTRQPEPPFPTNWELSTARSTEVLRYLVGQGVPPALVSAIGYGDARPLAAGGTPQDLAQNRRTDIVVLSSSPEDVRALFDEALAELETVVASG